MLKIPFSGGPHSGKTTINEALQEMYPEVPCVPEAAAIVIERELAKQEADPSYTAIMPVANYPAFQPLVLQEALKLESEVPKDTRFVFQDRSLIDHIGYCHLNGLEEAIPEIERHIEKANYAFAFFCEPVGAYQQTKIRRETLEQARATHDAISLAYDLSNVNTIHLPAVSVEERLGIIATTLEPYGLIAKK